MEVFVRDNDVNAALRALKRKMQREGTFREMKRRRGYESRPNGAREGGTHPLSSEDAARAARTEGVSGRAASPWAPARQKQTRPPQEGSIFKPFERSPGVPAGTLIHRNKQI